MLYQPPQNTNAQTRPTRRSLPNSNNHSTGGASRLYAIGDLHGRLDLLKAMLSLITADCADANTTPQLVFLGDYIDRGLESRAVIDCLISLNQPARFLLGNHEAVMRDVLASGSTQLAFDWCRFGGRETMLSYGVRPPLGHDEKLMRKAINELKEAVPTAHANFLTDLEGSVTEGDYFFCHAGVRPGVALAEQSLADLAWIRREFIPHQEPYEKLIIHGHTVREEPDVQNNRIGIDTGAYATGCLTALALEGTQQWILQTA